MAGVQQTMNSPPRRRDGAAWGYPYDYENSPHYGHQGAPRPGGYYSGAQGMYGGPPPQAGPPGNHPPMPPHGHAGHPGEYWSYEHPAARNNGYWGPPPGYDAYHHAQGADRHMPPPVRGPRGPHRHMGPEEHSPGGHLRVPPSPRTRLGRGADPSQQKRGDFLPPQPNKDNKGKKKADPLSVLANVSAGMTGKDGKKKQDQQQQEQQQPQPVPIPAPTSPLHRRPTRRQHPDARTETTIQMDFVGAV